MTTNVAAMTIWQQGSRAFYMFTRGILAQMNQSGKATRWQAPRSSQKQPEGKRWGADLHEDLMVALAVGVEAVHQLLPAGSDQVLSQGQVPDSRIGGLVQI